MFNFGARSGAPSPSGRGRREAPGEGLKARHVTNPHPPFGRPLPEGEGRRFARHVAGFITRALFTGKALIR